MVPKVRHCPVSQLLAGIVIVTGALVLEAYVLIMEHFEVQISSEFTEFFITQLLWPNCYLLYCEV